MYIPLGPSKKQLYKIIIALLLLCYLIFLGMYKPRAEVLGTGIYGLNYNDDNGVHWQTSCGVLDMTGNTGIGHCTLNTVNLYGNGNAKLYITNGGVLSNKTVSFVVFNGNNNIDVTGIFLEDNTTAYSCEIYSSLYNQNTMTYNVICPNLPTLTGNGTNINFMMVNQTPETFVVNLDFGISAINGFDSSNTTINDIKNTTNNINNSINDSSIDNSSANDLTSNSAFQDSNGLDAIIKAPLNFIQSLTSSTCSSISLTIPYIDANVSLPCMSTIYNKALGQQLVNLIALVINGVVLYRYCLKILEIVHNAKNPNKDELEVLDL